MQPTLIARDASNLPWMLWIPQGSGVDVILSNWVEFPLASLLLLLFYSFRDILSLLGVEGDLATLALPRNQL